MKKCIVFVTYSYWPPQFGGELSHSIERFKGLKARGFEIIALTSGYPGLPSLQDDQGICVHRSPVIGVDRLARAIRRLIYPMWAFWTLLHMKFDIYHQGDTAGIDPATSTVIVWLLTRIARWKKAHTVIVHSLADTERSTFDTAGWYGYWRRALFACFDHIVAVSPALYQGLYSIFPKRARLIVYGVRDDTFTPLDDSTRKNFRHEHNISNDQVVFSFLGTVGTRKGFDLLAQAFASLVGKYPDWRLWVIGPHLPSHSQNLDVEDVERVTQWLKPFPDKVMFWGRINDRLRLNRLLSASDVFVFPSRREGMGLAPVEAMSAGVPVIIARIPDVTDLANLDGETGYYIPVNDAQALAVAMEKLGLDAASRLTMGCRAAQRVRERFGWQAHLDEWEKLFLLDKEGNYGSA